MNHKDVYSFIITLQYGLFVSELPKCTCTAPFQPTRKIHLNILVQTVIHYCFFYKSLSSFHSFSLCRCGTALNAMPLDAVDDLRGDETTEADEEEAEEEATLLPTPRGATTLTLRGAAPDIPVPVPPPFASGLSELETLPIRLTLLIDWEEGGGEDFGAC